MILLLSMAFANPLGAPPESRANDGVEPRVEAPGGLEFLGIFQARGTANDWVSENPFIDGQVLGTLGGTNGIGVQPGNTSLYTEQRAGAFLTYTPPVLGGAASLTGAFEVDFALGDTSYGTGGNVGGGFGADQVNLQTRRLHADFVANFSETHRGTFVVGLQFVGDGVNDPTAVGPDGLLRSGGRLMFFGSEAAGVTLYGNVSDAWGDRVRYRIGTYTLHELGLGVADDVWLSMADLQLHPAYATTVGVHLWYLQDRSGGDAGALGVGPGSALWEMQGGFALDPWEGTPRPDDAWIDADLLWVGLDGGYNADLSEGMAGVHGVAVANLGRIYAPIAHDDDVVAMLADVEGRIRYAPGRGSVIRLEGLYSSGQNQNADTWNSVFTGNTYGIAGAVHATHGTYLLFPDPGSINRMVAVVYDVSGQGRGVTALTGGIGYDPIPDRLNLGVGGGTAFAGDGSTFGTEVNARVVGNPHPFLDVGLHGAVLAPGGAAQVEEVPWAVYAAVNWLVF